MRLLPSDKDSCDITFDEDNIPQSEEKYYSQNNQKTNRTKQVSQKGGDQWDDSIYEPDSVEGIKTITHTLNPGVICWNSSLTRMTFDGISYILVIFR